MSVPGSNIALLRRQMGLSQRQLAIAAEVDYSTLSRLESGKGGYSPESLDRIAKVLQVSKGVLFAEPGVVEAAALGMREVPVVTYAELRVWGSPQQPEFADRDRFLHADPKAVSLHAFALIVSDEVNAPTFLPGDQLLFDAKRQPRLGNFVVAQDAEGSTFIGRFRPLGAGYDIVPDNWLHRAVSVATNAGLQLRGVLAEHRRMYPQVVPQATLLK